MLFDRQGRPLAVLEAKSTSVDLSAGEAQGRRYDLVRRKAASDICRNPLDTRIAGGGGRHHQRN